MKKRIVLAILTIALLCSTLVYGGTKCFAADDYNCKYQAFISDGRWSNGTGWGYYHGTHLGYSALGCCAYCADFEKYVYGTSGWCGSPFYSASEIKNGDILHVTCGEYGEHWFVVLSRNGNSLYTAEGNCDSKVMISNSRYTISGNTVSFWAQGSTHYYSIIEGYHYNTTPPQPEKTYDPQGSFDSISSDEGKINISGWAFDKDNTSTSLQIHVYIDGPSGTGKMLGSGVANISRPDVNSAYGVGNSHGFNFSLSTSLYGKHSVYVYAINIGKNGAASGGNNTLLGSKTVDIKPESPKLKDDGYYHCTVLPDDITSDEYVIEYNNRYEKVQKDSPGTGWTKSAVVKNEWVNSGAQYQTEAELPTSDSRVLVKSLYYHFCGPNAGNEGNYEQTGKFVHYDDIDPTRYNVRVVAQGMDGTHPYYLLDWADGGGRIYCRSGISCGGEYGTHGARCQAWYKMNYYQDRVKVESYKYKKESGWVGTKDGSANSVEIRFKKKEVHKHEYMKKVVRKSTCIDNGIAEYTCECGDSYEERLPLADHTPVTDQAKEPTATTDGLTEGSHCAVCGKILKKQEVIPATGVVEEPEPEEPKTEEPKTEEPKTEEPKKEEAKIDISGQRIAPIGTKVYTGSAIKPAVSIWHRTYGNLYAGVDYTVKYTNNVNVGTATVEITGKGWFTGTVTMTFKILPKGTGLKTVTAGSKSMKVTWQKQTGKMKTDYIKGYQIQYSTSSTFAGGNKLITVDGRNNVSRNITKLTAGKKYYVRIRTYMVVKGVKYYSSWSSKKVVTVKK